MSSWQHITDSECLSPQPSCAFPVCHDTEERCRLVLSYVLEVSFSLDVIIQRRLRSIGRWHLLSGVPALLRVMFYCDAFSL